jgi:5-deoxy-glucuronate isomerase
MAVHLREHRGGFGPGRTPITALDEAQDPTGIALSIWRLRAGERVEHTTPGETAFLWMAGTIEVELEGRRERFVRESLFDQAGATVHLPAGQTVRFFADGEAELCVFATANTRSFAGRLIRPDEVRLERRGAGQVHDAALRWVRTIFDRGDSPPEAELVLGEVVTFPGRWSSYPPHHHPQPEIYHYRFDRPHGYGHAELGEAVVKVRHNDTIKILDGVDHPQCAAPGYAMWYSWVIRHLPQRPYETPEFDPSHRWTMGPGATTWWGEPK